MSAVPPTPIDSASVTVLIVAFNGRQLLDDCLRSLFRNPESAAPFRVLVVDNGSVDGTADFVRETFPTVQVIRSETNRGFAGGNNLGWDWVHAHWPDVRTLVLLNQDTVVAPGWLTPLVGCLATEPGVAIVQPMIRLNPETGKINTAGNRSHFLGFGILTGYGETDAGQFAHTRSIDFASGAALAIRTETIERVGLFTDELFLYLEDAELSWKARLAGWDVRLVPESVVYHKYVWRQTGENYFYLERNRWLLVLTYYRLPTLLLLSPAFALMELGQWLYAAAHGLLRERVRLYAALSRPRLWRWIRERRSIARRLRTIPDRQFVGRFTGKIEFPPLNSRLLRYVGNPILAGYWWLARLMMWW